MLMYCPNPDCPHAIKTGESAEYRGGFTHCRDCGSTLVETKPVKSEDFCSYEEFVPVFKIGNAALVPFVKSLLQSADIRFFVKGERVQDLFGFGRFGPGFNLITGPPTVYVEPDRAEEARELLDDIEEDPTNDDV